MRKIKQEFNNYDETIKIILISIILCVVFSSIYFLCGRYLIISNNNTLESFDNFFEIDLPRVIGDMAITNANHYRTSVHPLFVIFINPIGSFLAKYLSPNLVARLINSGFGGLGVSILFILLFNISKKMKNALAFSIMFGFSSSQIILSAIPDVSTIAIIGLLLMYVCFYLTLKSRKVNLWIWIFIGVITLGITLTNFLQTFICFLLSLIFIRKNSYRKFKPFSSLFIFVLGTLSISVFLSIIQKFFYPSSSLFFKPNSLFDEQQWASLLIFHKPGKVILEVLKNVFLVNIIAPTPTTLIKADNFIPIFSFQGAWNYSVLAWIFVICWIILLTYALYKNIRRKNDYFYFGISLCLLYNFALHCFYGVTSTGIELFVYSGYFTFLVIILVSDVIPLVKKWISYFIFILLLVLGINNLLQIRMIGSELRELVSYEQMTVQPEEQNDPILIKYREELEILRNATTVVDLPDSKIFFFGMGQRNKYIYKNGFLLSLPRGEIIKSWSIRSETIIPPSYKVNLITSSGEKVEIFEDEKGIWLVENGTKELLSGGSEINLPTFEGESFNLILRVLHQEILLNVMDGKPLPNFLVYSDPWYRDGAMTCMVLDLTDNLSIIKDWIQSLNEPFDKNNAGIEEADNLGEVLYMVSLVSDSSQEIVGKVLKIVSKNEEQGYINGLTDFCYHPVYQTAWLKFGLKSLGLSDPFYIPNVPDTYSGLIWWYKGEDDIFFSEPMLRSAFPYLNWAAAHTANDISMGLVGSIDYPLSWESNSSEADYSMMGVVYNSNNISVPHSWAASEMFLYLYCLE